MVLQQAQHRCKLRKHASSVGASIAREYEKWPVQWNSDDNEKHSGTTQCQRKRDCELLQQNAGLEEDSAG